jgi:hypothetical protein
LRARKLKLPTKSLKLGIQKDPRVVSLGKFDLVGEGFDPFHFFQIRIADDRFGTWLGPTYFLLNRGIDADPAHVFVGPGDFIHLRKYDFLVRIAHDKK